MGAGTGAGAVRPRDGGGAVTPGRTPARGDGKRRAGCAGWNSVKQTPAPCSSVQRSGQGGRAAVGAPEWRGGWNTGPGGWCCRTCRPTASKARYPGAARRSGSEAGRTKSGRQASCTASGIGDGYAVLSRRMASDQRGPRSSGGKPWVNAFAKGSGRNAGSEKAVRHHRRSQRAVSMRPEHFRSGLLPCPQTVQSPQRFALESSGEGLCRLGQVFGSVFVLNDVKEPRKNNDSALASGDGGFACAGPLAAAGRRWEG